MISYYKNTLLELFNELNQIYLDPVNNIELIRDIQLRLIKKTFYIENKIKRKKESIKSLKKEKSNLPRTSQSKEIALKIKDIIKSYDMDIDDYQRILGLLKKIGDGIAFSLFQKWDIKPASFKDSSGFISGKQGFILEKQLFNRAFNNGIPAILNDLTNCFKYGDLTIINPKNGLPYFIEAKSSANVNNRIIRQKDKLLKLTKYLETDEIDNFYDTIGTMKRISYNKEENNYIDLLNKMIMEALKTGNSFELVEKGLAYFVTTFFSKTDINTLLNKLDFKPVVNVVNDFKLNKESRGYFPFVLSIKEPLAKYMFFTGELIILCFTDLNEIIKHFESRGIIVSIEERDNFLLKLYDSKREVSLQVSSHFFYRVYSEFISLEWMLNEIYSQIMNIKNKLEIVV